VISVKLTNGRAALTLAVISCVALGVHAEPVSPTSLEVSVLLRAMGSGDVATSFGPTISQQIVASLRQADPNISQHVQDIVVEVTLSYLRRRAEQDHLVDQLVPIYMKYLTKADVQQLTQFYQSPIGKKLVSLNPQITLESAAIGRAWAAFILPGLQAEITGRLEKEKLLN
jgi:hypothetical protein